MKGCTDNPLLVESGNSANSSSTGTVQSANKPGQQTVLSARETASTITGITATTTKSRKNESRRDRRCCKSKSGRTKETSCQKPEQSADTNHRADCILGEVYGSRGQANTVIATTIKWQWRGSGPARVGKVRNANSDERAGNGSEDPNAPKHSSWE